MSDLSEDYAIERELEDVAAVVDSLWEPVNLLGHAVREALDGALPDSLIVVMPGHGPAAMDTGTDLFTTEVLRFVEDPS